MRLPGTRYQEHGWEQVRKLLGQCSLGAFAAPALCLDAYVEQMSAALYRVGSRFDGPGNSYGDSVRDLALTLLYELQARPGDWDEFQASLPVDAGEALLRKKVNDMYATLRDKVDSDNYQVACGRACSPNRIYAYRMLDTAYHEIARLFADWRSHALQVGAILGREVLAAPIEVRQMTSIAGCRPEWVLRWSASCGGPLHTRSKRFEALKDNPAKIGVMLAEIAEYEALSANRDADWRLDAGEATDWLDDYWRVLAAPEQTAPAPDRILEARQEPIDLPMDVVDTVPLVLDPASDAVAASVALPPGFIQMAQLAEDRHSWAARMMMDDGLPVRLAVYLKLTGPEDDVYPDAWCDPATRALPTMQQLAVLAGVSLPTLRKRRDAAIARLMQAAREKETT
ncbi:hypothetical protein [Massilia sp. S19_KUP03_FR1]|uniref:hypothetical protein n=1 Tax=Massilia sp. S19_KUP03_FR1 TaxID=3025503 RepID=UPI002FCDB19A